MAHIQQNTAEGFMVSDIEFGELKGKVQAISETVEKTYKLIYGNGQKGLYEVAKETDARISANAEHIASLSENIDKLQKAVGSVSDKVEQDCDDLKDHLNDPKRTFKYVVMENIKTLFIWFAVAFVVLHSILPPNFSVWTLVEKLF